MNQDPNVVETTDVDGMGEVPELSATAVLAAGEITKHNKKKQGKK